MNAWAIINNKHHLIAKTIRHTKKESLEVFFEKEHNAFRLDLTEKFKVFEREGYSCRKIEIRFVN